MAKRATPTKGRVLQRTKGSPANPAKSEEQRESAASNLADLETFHFHMGNLKRLDDQIAAVRKLRKDERRRASDAGINLADLDMIMKMREEEPETVQARVERIATYAHWAGLAPGFQGDLFQAAGEKEDAEKVAELEGYKDGIEGLTATGERYDAGNPIGQARMRGHAKGQEVLHDRFLSKQKPETHPAPETQQ